MQFFKPLTELLTDGQMVTLIITKGTSNELTVGFLPEIKDKAIAAKLPMLTIQGTPAEFDADFFEHVKPVLIKVEGLTSNVKKIEETEIDVEEEKTEASPKAPSKAKGKEKAPIKPLKKGQEKRENPMPELLMPSIELATITGSEPISRVEVTKKVWDYIKAKKLQDKKQKSIIVADDTLKKIIGKDTCSQFDLAKIMNTHLTPASAKATNDEAGEKTKPVKATKKESTTKPIPTAITDADKKKVQKMLASELDDYILGKQAFIAEEPEHPQVPFAKSCLEFATAEREGRQAPPTPARGETAQLF